ncbi:hypothetical protein E1176_13920 [Fulvivirga sp. RKSG066]|uniref:carboxypeptidase-like regulatory domain-containing protein n=1 Tax=Fulvivirga aurantia TaxID=2529383 RepID=UPI0012BC3A38|nr:carboxypeptidase-like regulatory domain-containing protein [Fulvivirga aurantia]MTI22123.1 hypothetical protein [Fulvivirga aurantia]
MNQIYTTDKMADAKQELVRPSLKEYKMLINMRFATLLFTLLVIPTLTSLAQSQSIEAIVIDGDSKKPVSYATIIYPEQQYGFSANANGYFKIKMVNIESAKKIVISSIGYQQYESTLGKMIEDQVDTIILNPKVTILKEVLVKAETETPKEMIEQTSKYLKDFLGSDPYYLFINYRESVKKNDKYVGYTEAMGMMHVSGYQPGFNNKNEVFAYDLAQWKHLRRVIYLIPSECDREKKRALGIKKLTKAKAKYLYDGPFTNLDDFDYTIDSLTNFNDTDVFIISFTPLSKKHSFAGKAYIKVDDYALVSLEVTEENANKTLYDKCTISPETNFKINYTKVGDRYFLKNTEMELAYVWNNTVIKEHLALSSEEFSRNETIDLNYDQRMVVYNEMINPSVAFNDSFWSKNELPQELDTDLGTNMSLQKQFFSNSGKRPIPLPKDVANYEQLYKNRDLFRLFVNQEF